MSSHHARVPVATTEQAAPVAAPEVEPVRRAVPSALAPAAVPGLASPPAAGLTVGHAADPAERAADELADRALGRLRSSSDGTGDASEPDAHRHDPGCGHLRRSTDTRTDTTTAAATDTDTAPAASVGLEGGDLDAATSRRIESRRGGGAPLPGAVRRRMETAFGTGLGHVRVHDGPEAAGLSAAVSAEAFTTGSDIFFGAGRFAPGSADGEKVLAHEIAHVVQEGPATVRRWPWSKKKTPEEQAAQEKAKADEKAKAQAVKQSKLTEKSEKKQLSESREVGVAGRAQMQEDLYSGTGPDTAGTTQTTANGTFTQLTSGAGAQMTDLYKLMDTARAREVEVFAEMRDKKLGGSDAQRAKLAYKQVWYVEFPQLTHVRPARETDAEVLVAQVRQVRGEAAAGESAAAVDEATTKERMLPKKVEVLYDRMVVELADLMAADPEASEVLATDEAREKVLASVDAKVLADVPPKDGPLDMAAWAAAAERGKARKRQADRDAANVQANLMLLDPTQRVGPQQQEQAPVGKGASDAMEKVGTYGGYATKAVDKVGGGIAGKIGSGQDKELRKDLPKDGDKDPKSPVPGFLDPLGVGAAYTSGAKADSMRTKGQRDIVEKDLPTSDATKAKEGIGNVTAILTSLIGAVQSALGMAQQIEASWKTKDPYEGLKAAKSGSAALSGLVTAAKETANLAKTIDGGVAAGVKSVIPGLDIATAALAMVSGVTDVATTGMRQRETDNTLFEARAGSTDKVNVAVYPLMKVSQVYTKQLEKNCWWLGASILDFSLSIAQVASAGGFGIPAAIKASAAVVNKLHDLGHYIADKVLAAQAKRAEKESSVQHLEGAAEDELKKHPKMAVDGLIMRAAQGDAVAIAFLGNYRIEGKPITKDYLAQIKPKPLTPFDPNNPNAGDDSGSEDGLLLKVRAAVLAGMDVESDPQSVYDDLKSQVDAVAGKGGALKDAWQESGDLRTQRNDLAGKGGLGANQKSDRGIFWQLRMTLSSEKRQKLKNRTQAYAEGVEALPQGVACAVGSHELKLDATPVEMKQFSDTITAAEIEAELTRTPRRNSPEWVAFLRDALRAKKAEESAAKSGAKQPVGAGAPSIGSHRGGA
ncbi:DUF4157 domain-containing protein [Cellulomonas sp. DKR-3]|uniref:DUF4157 domain-containing protein n=1 Tax=Cellulomonas fulva TaxID=2835530 RepID=A0ABS5TV42_9CELL|nr:DUF4157 domain-containing protein [Cellulomonas fulva]MBT0993019.1 DUF4157 domain-containing protein [Cellulomonas fulva]